MIAEIREYIRGIVYQEDPDLKENPSAFLDDDLGESILDKSYQISIGGMTKIVRDSHTEREIPIQLTIFGYGLRDQIANYDYLLERAICIEDGITDLKNFSGVETITNIISNGIEASKYLGADDAYRIDINLTLTQAYSRE